MCRSPQRRAGACSRRFDEESNLAYGKSQRLLRRSLRAKALGFFCPFRFATLPKLHSNYSGISASLFTKRSRETTSAFDGAPLLFGITAKFHARRDDAQP